MKAFIFDLDGVIVSTDALHYAAWKHVADEEKIYFDEEINNELRGISRMESLEILLRRAHKEYSSEEKLMLAEKKNRVYRELLRSLTPADRLQGVNETLAELRRRGYLLAIGSSSKNAPVILEKIGYGEYFDAVSDGNNIARGKPDPEVFLHAASALRLPPAECYVVEDAAAGIRAAVVGGFVPVGIGEAATCEQTAVRLQRFSDLLEL